MKDNLEGFELTPASREHLPQRKPIRRGEQLELAIRSAWLTWKRQTNDIRKPLGCHVLSSLITYFRPHLSGNRATLVVPDTGFSWPLFRHSLIAVILYAHLTLRRRKICRRSKHVCLTAALMGNSAVTTTIELLLRLREPRFIPANVVPIGRKGEF